MCTAVGCDVSGRERGVLMSVQPQAWPQPDEQVAAAIRAMYGGTRQRPLPVRVRDELGELFPDAEFAEAFGTRGKPGWSPGRLAMVTVLQMAQDLTDRQTADEVRTNLAWKYCLGLALDDAGFDASVLSEFRSRVVAHQMEEKVLDLLLARLKDKNLLAAGGKQRTDSTHVISAVRDLHRLELAGESVRAALEALSACVPHWVEEALEVSDWSRRYAERMSSWRFPTSQAKREELARAYGEDGFALLKLVYAPVSPVWLRELPAVQVLRTVLLQNYSRITQEDGREVIRRRERSEDGGEGLPPCERRLASPYDTDARWGSKRNVLWLGYKLHITETCTREGEETGPGNGLGGRTPPNLITNVATTHAAVADAAMTTQIHQDLERRELLPAEHYLDSGYPAAELLVTAKTTFGITLVTPLTTDTSAQARAGAGYHADAFAIDFEHRMATCPQGQTSTAWSPCKQKGRDKIVVTFPATICRPCPARAQCTTSRHGRRQISIYPDRVHQARQAALTAQGTESWRVKYSLRAGVEGTIRQAVAVTGSRHTRYRGLAKTHLEHVSSATALNLIRLNAWWNGHPLDRGRTSHFARLDSSLLANAEN